MLKKILYWYSKIILKLQLPSIRDCEIHKTSKVGYRSNVIRLKMDKNSYIGNNNSLMDVNIGKYCSIASYCSIGGGNHPSEWISTSPFFYSYLNTENVKNNNTNSFSSGKTVEIGNDVWIGENCFIKDGVNIGNGVILGAHSVVTKDIPDYAIAVGNPAKVIKYRFDDQTISKLLKIQWWDLDEDSLEKYKYLFNDPQKFFQVYERKVD